MQKQAPSVGRLLVISLFALSCFGLLLFLWVAFGGPIPFKPQGYRFHTSFQEATQLSANSDVRISGVPVGKVKTIELGDDGRADATIELEEKYAPLPRDARAILRQKTLLGETFVELTRGSKAAATIPEGGQLATSRVSDTVQLDEIFRSFDDRTRENFRAWMQNTAIAVNGRGADLSAAIGNLEPFVRDTDELVRLLRSERNATTQLVRNTGEVFSAISERQGQLSGLINNSNRVFLTTARRDRELREIFTVFPTFLQESRLTLNRLDRFAKTTNPLITQLRPSARQLSPLLIDTNRLAPDFRGFFKGLKDVTKDSRRGLPALNAFLDNDLPPLLGQFVPFTQQLNPILDGAGLYKREITAFLGNAAAATNGTDAPGEAAGKVTHYLRASQPLSPEVVAAYPRRLNSNRANAYVEPGGSAKLAGGLDVFDTRNCGAGGANASIANVDPNTFPGGADLFARLKEFAFANQNQTSQVPATGCAKQAKFSSIGRLGEQTDYLHVYAEP